MHMGSCTKAMTATMIGTLVEEGKLSWKSTIRTVFPESAEQLHPQFQGVDAFAIAHASRRVASRRPLVELAGINDNPAAARAHDEHARAAAVEPARVDLCLLERRLRTGRSDGRAGYGRIVGDA